MDSIDFYGTTYSLNTLGKSSYKTWVSFISSVATIILMGVTTYLIGKDFFFKMNPQVVSGSKMPEQSEPLHMSNSNFTVAFRIEDPNEVPLSDSEVYAYPHFVYHVFKRTEQGNMNAVFEKIYNPIPCDQTDATKNPLLDKFNPSTLLCFDLERIRTDRNLETNLTLQGGWDEDYLSFFLLVYSNCKYKEGDSLEPTECVSYEEAIERDKQEQYLSLFLPRTTFDPENEEKPVVTYTDNIYYRMNPFSSMYQIIKYSFFKFSDDKGWIFEDKQQTVTVHLDSDEKAFRFLQKEAFEEKRANMFMLDLYFQRKQLTASRMYVKIQQLAANLGGVMKLLTTIFGFVNRTYAHFRVESNLLTTYGKTIGAKAGIKENNLMNSSVSVANLKERNKSHKISFKQYLLIKLGFSKNLKKEKHSLKIVRTMLDIDNFVKICCAQGKNNLPTDSQKVKDQTTNSRAKIAPFNEIS